MVEALDLFGGVYADRRVFVTGHTGFKGSWLCEWLLGLGANVTGYALEPPTDPSLFDELALAGRVEHGVADIRDAGALTSALARAEPEVVFHLAAQPLVREGYVAPVYTYETNVMGTVNVLDAARQTPSVRVVVNVTSDKCYENRETLHAYREDEPLGGLDPYSSSKACSELVTAAYRASFFGPDSSVRVASVRAGNVIGGGDWATDRLVPDCVRALQAGETIQVRNPQAVRPWQHVLEPLAGYLLLTGRLLSGRRELDGAWNFGPQASASTTVGEVVDAVIAAWGSGEWEGTLGRRSEPREAGLLAIDATKASKVLGWRPVLDVGQAVAATMRWYRGRAAGDDVRVLTRQDIREYVAGVKGRGGYPE